MCFAGAAKKLAGNKTIGWQCVYRQESVNQFNNWIIRAVRRQKKANPVTGLLTLRSCHWLRRPSVKPSTPHSSRRVCLNHRWFSSQKGPAWNPRTGSWTRETHRVPLPTLSRSLWRRKVSRLSPTHPFAGSHPNRLFFFSRAKSELVGLSLFQDSFFMTSLEGVMRTITKDELQMPVGSGRTATKSVSVLAVSD